MLLSLKIANFALIDQLELSFDRGLNVLTGETGAGKSIILDALDIVVGGKAQGSMIRTGSTHALIEATFQITPAIATWLHDHEIDPLDDDLLICSRELTLNGGSLRSRSRVNGVLVNRHQLDVLRDHLIEITAQGQTTQLSDPAQHRQWLDNFGGAALLIQRHQVATAFSAFQSAQRALEQRQTQEQQRLQRLDFLTFQFQELQALGLHDPEELDHLTQEAQRLGHSVELKQQSYNVYQALYEHDNGGLAAADLIGNALNDLEDMLVYDPQLQPILDLVQDAATQIEEAGRQISLYGNNLETDPQRLSDVEERRTDLKQICRKYGPTLVDVIDHWHQIESELAELNDDDQSLESLAKTVGERLEALVEACQGLTQLRQHASTTLETILLQALKPLAMEKARFQVNLSAIQPSAHGAEHVIFMLSSNPGEPLLPLAAVASGGEMSRFLLALKTCLKQTDDRGTLVFDEIDVGISGRVTQAIAQNLYQLSRQHQVLCVTHQPIVAAMADSHYQVQKQEILSTDSAETTEALRTVVRVAKLSDEERRTELAQLAGGRSGEDTIAFADSLLHQAVQLKQPQPEAAPAPKQRKRKSGSSKVPSP